MSLGVSFHRPCLLAKKKQAGRQHRLGKEVKESKAKPALGFSANVHGRFEEERGVLFRTCYPPQCSLFLNQEAQSELHRDFIF